MSQKVKLPKEVCDALDFAKKHDYLVKALIFGYEPEMTPEEQMKEAYLLNKDMEIKDVFEQGMQVGYSMGVRETLRIHGIHYDWLEGDAE